MTLIKDFELIQDKEIPELNTRGRLFRHVKTGTELLSLENDDENKVFTIVFRTTPEDDTGVAHIIEHSVLSGSEKYPVKEPFVELLKGSLQTFVNAFTFPDKTCYPCASQNVQDFYNLIDVYMDAVLHPLLHQQGFDQEAWHFELENLKDPLTYKGIVFNEMKGNYSDPNGILQEHNQQTLFPDNTYQQDSGGNPKHITDLTFEQFKEFHDKFYHPSNARITWYGDDDPEERLIRTAEYLEGYDRLEVDSSIPLQEKFSEPRKFTEQYPAGEGDEAKCFLAVNWLLPDQSDPEVTLSLGILNHILVGTPASPLRKALIDSGLGEDLVGGGLGIYLRQLTFSTGLKGIESGDASQVEALISETLKTLAKDGIDPDMVAASMNTIEFTLRENNTGRFPRGLSQTLNALSTWLYDGDPFVSLTYEAPLQAVKEKVASGSKYFETLIQEHFIDNNHRTIVLLEPDSELNQRQDKEEETRLAEIRKGMSEEDLKSIIEKTRKVKELQETPDTPEALASLPVLTLADLDKENKTIPIEEYEDQGVKTLYHDIFTNGILYLEVGFDLHSLPQETLPYLDLFADGMVKMGTESEDFVKLSQRIGRETGGISPTVISQQIRDSKESASWLILQGKSTVDKAGELLAIYKDILLTTEYDNQDRFRQILMERKAGMESALVPSGHSVVYRRLRGRQNEAGWAGEQMSGIDNLFFTRDLIDQIEYDWPGVAAKFKEIREMLIDRGFMLCNVTLDNENWKQVKPQLSSFIGDIPNGDAKLGSWTPSYTSGPEGLTIPANVNYVGKGANLYELGYKLDGSVSVISKYVGMTYIWERIRAQGGAYGGMFLFDSASGSLNYLSYRDPNLLSSLDNYDGTSEFLKELEISDAELTKSIIGTIGDMDAYQLPDAKGFTSLSRYLTGYSDEDRQNHRDQVLSTKAKDFKEFAMYVEQVIENGHVIVLGSAEAIEEANNERAGFLNVKKVM